VVLGDLERRFVLEGGMLCMECKQGDQQRPERTGNFLILQRLWEEPEEYSGGCAERDVVRMEDTVVGFP
jgi:hypothetical protein